MDSGPLADQPLLVISQPFYTTGGFAGYMVLGVPRVGILTRMTASLQSTPVDIVTFNSRGEVVRGTRSQAVINLNLPASRDLTTLVGQDPSVFRARSAGDEDRIYAVVPIVPEVAYSMSIWRPEDMEAGIRDELSLSSLLPVLMWLASLVVAFWSLNRLAVRHIQKLGRQMRHFAYNRRVPRTTLGPGVPRELEDIQTAFVRMADSIVRDEAALEDSLRDKNILLKEVHHRVKNNLQLISSIMNMQIRRAQSEDARRVLKRLQERILSLATVHKNLYQTDKLDRVDAGKLIEEIIGQLLVVGLSVGQGIKVSQSYDSVEMDADDAAPLTLLVSEAVTNAMKYIGTPHAGGNARLEISLRKTSEAGAVFRIANSTAGAQGSEGTGLGTQLISAFARQLNGQVEVSFADEEHVLQITFPIRQRAKDRYDF
jgi:two-component sensor histidine kinase